ncbi:MAG: hypothetical protein JWO91_2544 [Acidobacteriaceae bacterium]|nr:hypothetical protein [Acidobacteriaceae bacterium]
MGANLWCLLEVRRRLGVFPYNRTYLRLAVPFVTTLVALLWLHQLMRTVHPEWVVIAGALILGHAVFLATAAAVGLEADDKLIISALWYRVQNVFGFSGANA